MRPYTIHSVLAGAYGGARRRGNPTARELARALDHASVDDGASALCGRVKPESLCDVGGDAVTCPACLSKIAVLELTAKQ